MFVVATYYGAVWGNGLPSDRVSTNVMLYLPCLIAVMSLGLLRYSCLRNHPLLKAGVLVAE